MKLANFLQTGVFRIVVVVSMLVQGFTALPTPVQAQAPTLPTKAEVAAVMQKVNDQWQSRAGDNPGDNGWARAVYFTGNMAHYEMTGDVRYLNYAKQWAATVHNWQLKNNCSTVDADDQTAGQTYLALYELEPETIKDPNKYLDRLRCLISSTQTSMVWATLGFELPDNQQVDQFVFYPDQDYAYRYFVSVKDAPDKPFTRVVDRVENTEGGMAITNTLPQPVAAKYISLTVVGAYNLPVIAINRSDYITNLVRIREFQVFNRAQSSINPINPITNTVRCWDAAKNTSGCNNAIDRNLGTYWQATVPKPEGPPDWKRNSPDWWWVDAFYMAMPAYAKLSLLRNDPLYSQMMYVRYSDAKDQRDLYDPTYHLWYRDGKYLAERTDAQKKVLWSRGNGWVFAALARTIDILPKGAPHRENEYLATFEQMAMAITATQLYEDLLLPTQLSEGYWSANLADPNDAPGPESSGTALFTYGLAWGINSHYLKREEYEATMLRGWNWLVNNAIQPDYEVGYVQTVASEPATTTYVTTTDYGTGLFLLAASEVYKLATESTNASNLALNRPVTCSSEPEAQTHPCAYAVDGSLDAERRWSATPYPQSIEVDLGDVYQVNQVRVHPFDNRAYRFKIEVKRTASDPYTLVVDRSGNQKGAAFLEGLFAPNDARYVKLTVSDAVGNPSGWVSIREFEVFGKTASAANLAYKKTVTCSSQPQSDNACANLTDNILINRWSAQGYSQWAEIDLGTEMKVNRVRVHPYSNRAYRYVVQVKTTSGDYMTIVDRSSNQQNAAVFEDAFAETSARYVRLRVDGASGYDGGWVSIKEFQVFDQQIPQNNLALSRVVTSSLSTQPEPQNSHANAVDGNLNNRWSSMPYPQWLEVDLGKVYKINRVKLHTYLDRTYQFTVEVRLRQSEKFPQLNPLVSETTCSPSNDRALQRCFANPTDARFVRLTVGGASNYTGNWVSIREFEVFDEKQPIVTLINSLLGLEAASTQFKPQPVNAAPAGTLTLYAVFRNQSTTGLDYPYFQVTQVTANNMILNAEDGPTGSGAVIRLPNSLPPGESYVAEFQVGLQTLTRFQLMVDAFAVPGGVSASALQSLGSFEFTIDESMLQVNPDDPGQGNPIYLPLISR